MNRGGARGGVPPPGAQKKMGKMWKTKGKRGERKGKVGRRRKKKDETEK